MRIVYLLLVDEYHTHNNILTFLLLVDENSYVFIVQGYHTTHTLVDEYICTLVLVGEYLIHGDVHTLLMSSYSWLLISIH